MIDTPFSEFIKRTAGDSGSWMDYNGFALAVIVKDEKKEIAAGRTSLAVLDVSGMNKHKIKGPDAAALLDKICTRELSRLAVGRVAYTLLVAEDGMIRDDATVFRLADDHFMLMCTGNLLDWMKHHKGNLDVSISLVTHDWAQLSVYGPKSATFLDAAGIKGLDALRAFNFMKMNYHGTDLIVSRTGFSGGLGYELLIPWDKAAAVLEALVASPGGAGITFVGAAASTNLGIEVGFVVPGWYFPVPGHGSDADPSNYRSPYDLGMGWLVDLNRGNFVGKQALEKISEDGPRHNLVAVEITKELDAGSIGGTRLFNQDGNDIGVILAGAFSLTLGKFIGLCTVKPGSVNVGDEVKAGKDKCAAVIRRSPVMTFAERTQTPPPGV